MVCPMFALSRTSRSLASLGSCSGLLLTILCAAPGCKRGDADQPPPGASAADEVGRPLGDLELPVSLRTRDTAPTDAHAVEVTTEQLRLNGAPVIPLQKGIVAEADRSDGVITKLANAMRGQS